jgi:hypothetical protein
MLRAEDLLGMMGDKHQRWLVVIKPEYRLHPRGSIFSFKRKKGTASFQPSCSWPPFRCQIKDGLFYDEQDRLVLVWEYMNLDGTPFHPPFKKRGRDLTKKKIKPTLSAPQTSL